MIVSLPGLPEGSAYMLEETPGLPRDFRNAWARYSNNPGGPLFTISSSCAIIPTLNAERELLGNPGAGKRSFPG